MEIVATLALVAVLGVVLMTSLGKKKPRPVRMPIQATE